MGENNIVAFYEDLRNNSDFHTLLYVAKENYDNSISLEEKLAHLCYIVEALYGLKRYYDLELTVNNLVDNLTEIPNNNFVIKTLFTFFDALIDCKRLNEVLEYISNIDLLWSDKDYYLKNKLIVLSKIYMENFVYDKALDIIEGVLNDDINFMPAWQQWRRVISGFKCEKIFDSLRKIFVGNKKLVDCFNCGKVLELSRKDRGYFLNSLISEYSGLKVSEEDYFKYIFPFGTLYPKEEVEKSIEKKVQNSIDRFNVDYQSRCFTYFLLSYDVEDAFYYVSTLFREREYLIRFLKSDVESDELQQMSIEEILILLNVYEYLASCNSEKVSIIEERALKGKMYHVIEEMGHINYKYKKIEKALLLWDIAYKNSELTPETLMELYWINRNEENSYWYLLDAFTKDEGNYKIGMLLLNRMNERDVFLYNDIKEKLIIKYPRIEVKK